MPVGRTRGSSPSPTQLKAEIAKAEAKCISLCRKGGHGLQQRWTRCAATVDTVCWNGGHAGIRLIA
ncbi:hypothetical protein [Kibdelosporangium philippinense]|uniref:hypothetical protein n=1 Tax=Kibdelosporangium philippinense TaxID=211113 RepID=UPI00360C5F69